ncbi:MAG: type III pantothenate kinase [Lysobacterales bacterium]
MTGEFNLLLDWGNSRLKWTLAKQEQLQPMQAAVPQASEATFSDLWGDLDAPRQVVCVSVTDPQRMRSLSEYVAARWGCPLHIAGSQKTAGKLKNAYADPSQMGADRWIAMLGAAARYDGAFAVVDAGTAVTVDVVDSDGQHLGGWILPGRALMNQALTQHTEFLKPQLLDSPPTLGRDTESCIAGGVSATQLGALEWLKPQLPKDCDMVLCGGDSQWLNSFLSEADCQPDLVLQGLAAWLNHHEVV